MDLLEDVADLVPVRAALPVFPDQGEQSTLFHIAATSDLRVFVSERRLEQLEDQLDRQLGVELAEGTSRRRKIADEIQVPPHRSEMEANLPPCGFPFLVFDIDVAIKGKCVDNVGK